MTIIKTPIIPEKQIFANLDVPESLNYKAICVFVATGFFLDEDTFWNHKVCLAPASIHELDAKGNLVKSERWFNWNYNPKDATFTNVVDEYIELLTKITKEQIKENDVLLPLSGGLDSRSLAAVTSQFNNDVHGFSYAFKNGFPETRIAKQIAEQCKFKFSSYKIPPGYLWDCIMNLAKINGCYSEFTHPRQMAVVNKFKEQKGVFLLGHWGDVLFDRGSTPYINEENVSEELYKKMVKSTGVELGKSLWKFWNLEGNFEEYLRSRINNSFNKIKIDNLSAKIRAFKTEQWAHRWTTTNIEVFRSVNPIALPYYDNRMCEFVCNVDEEFLTDRKIQITHLKKYPDLAKITWQDHRPFSITNYGYNKTPYNLPYKIYNKVKLEINKAFGKDYIQRNWELQFVGKSNEEKLKQYLFSKEFNSFVPAQVVDKFYTKFKTTNAVQYAHAVSMLLTLSVFNTLYNK